MLKELEMTLRIEKIKGIGLCFGVRRALSLVERAARQHGEIETLGATVHNQPVLERLGSIGVRIASGLDDIKGKIVATSAHGISPQMEQEIRARHIDIIDTTCPFVQRAQTAARRLADDGFFVLVFGDASHPEVKGILGWANDKGLATLDEKAITQIKPLPHRLGTLPQTTQIPSQFNEFVKKLIDHALRRDSELRIVDTICHDIRRRQASTLELARKVELMLVIGGHESANTNRLVQLCSEVTRTYLVETAREVQTSWLRGRYLVGITSGASTSEETINEVIARLRAIA